MTGTGENPSSAPAQESRMSSLIGAQHERWSLPRAIDALSAAARQAGRPGLVWLLGVLYPTLSLTVGPGGALVFGLFHPPDDTHSASGILAAHDLRFEMWFVLTSILLLPRVSSGLARISSPEVWAKLTRERHTPRLRDAWQASRGIGWSALGLWTQVLLMLLLPALLVLSPPLYVLEHMGLKLTSLSDLSSVTMAVVLSPFVALLLLYALVLSLIYQLALQSLANNRRGAASALMHAWRIARQDPWATARAAIVDFVLSATVFVLQWVAFGVLAITCIGPPLGILGYVLLPGFAGVTRAGYWARVYRALGGLSPDDGVPGL